MTEIRLYGGGESGLSAYEEYMLAQEEAGRPVLAKDDWLASLQGPPGVLVDPDALPWEASKLYPAKSITTDAGSSWCARRATQGERPSESPDAWTVFVPGVDLVFAAQAVADVAAAGAAKVAEAAAEVARAEEVRAATDAIRVATEAAGDDRVAAAAAQVSLAQGQAQAAQAARSGAQAAQAAAEAAALVLGATAYPLHGDLPASGSSGAKAYVYADPDDALLGLYFWDGAAWVRDAINPAPLQRLLEEVSARSALIREGALPADYLAGFVDPMGFVQLLVTAAGALRGASGTLDVNGLLVALQAAGAAITSPTGRVDVAGLPVITSTAGGVAIGDAMGFIRAFFGIGEILLGGLRLLETGAGGVGIGDAAGFLQAHFGEREGYFYGLRVQPSDHPGVVFVDDFGFVAAAIGPGITYLVGYEADSAVEVLPAPPAIYAAPALAAAEGAEVTLYAEGLLPDRALIGSVDLTLIGASGVAVTSDRALTVQPDRLGASCDLIAAPRPWDGGARTIRPMSVHIAPVPAVAPEAIRVLAIGDSITNRQAAYLMDQALTAWGYLPQWVGTMRGSASASNAGDVTGPLGEGREGWETGDYTYAVTNRALVLPPGEEAVYLTMAKTDQRDRNPFIRAAAGGDAPEDVRNGQVLDFQFYLSRFGLAAPDLVLIGLGTNDVRDLEAGVIRAAVADNYALMIRRLRAALPDATILIWLPGTAREATRDQLWRDEYIPVLQGIADAMAAAGDARVILAPTWAMAPAMGGYAPDDPIHPIGGARAALFLALAGYVAAVAAGTL